MPGSLQRASLRIALERGIIPTPTGRFERLTSTKIRCRECEQTGYGPVDPTAATANPWQLAHMVDHRYPCSCGLRFAAPWHLATHIEPSRRAAGRADRLEHHWVT